VPVVSNGILIPMTIAMIVFEIIVLLFSAILHEIAHGAMAERLGDDTARRAGRLTLNPLVHLDPFGSLLLPLLLLWASGGSFFFAAAKPVPYDPRNLKDPRTGAAKIALAGPATNFLLALIFGIVIRIVSSINPAASVIGLLEIIVYINIILGIFNLVPIPPLDGSRLLYALLPQNEATFRIMYFLERWGMLLVIVFVFFGFGLLIPLINWIFMLFAGQPLGF